MSGDVSSICTDWTSFPENRRKMCSSFPLHFDSEYLGSVLQENVIFLLSIGWVVSLILHRLTLTSNRQTPPNKRQEYVNAFNKGTPRNSCAYNRRHSSSCADVRVLVVFLLSSKAGMYGLHLSGYLPQCRRRWCRDKPDW